MWSSAVLRYWVLKIWQLIWWSCYVLGICLNIKPSKIFFYIHITPYKHTVALKKNHEYEDYSNWRKSQIDKSARNLEPGSWFVIEREREKRSCFVGDFHVSCITERAEKWETQRGGRSETGAWWARKSRKQEAGESASRCVERKTAISQQHPHSKQTSNIIKHTEWDTLISLAPQEASIFRKSSKCKLIYYRKSSRGVGVQPKQRSRHQRVNPNSAAQPRESSALVNKS